nr:16S rRNA (guanine(527)-N(7))-methyltransferase RsmG [uncultured Desulfuromonas sp.]
MTLEKINQYLPPQTQLLMEEFEQLDAFLDELLLWNSKINLTAIRDKEVCWEKHIIDSLLVAEFLDQSLPLLDVGSGGGFPSIPLKIKYHQLDVTSVDTVGKKIQFQKHCARKLGLEGFVPVSSRIENLKSQSGHQFPQITSRAFRSIGLFCELCHGYLDENGKLVAMKGTDYQREIDESQEILSRLNLEIVNVHKRILLPSQEERFFVILEKKKAQ